jgi:hypothetical protein
MVFRDAEDEVTISIVLNALSDSFLSSMLGYCAIEKPRICISTARERGRGRSHLDLRERALVSGEKDRSHVCGVVCGSEVVWLYVAASRISDCSICGHVEVGCLARVG